eukprot:8835958-Alexandrium_andersonii.AAC.1
MDTGRVFWNFGKKTWTIRFDPGDGRKCAQTCRGLKPHWDSDMSPEAYEVERQRAYGSAKRLWNRMDKSDKE